MVEVDARGLSCPEPIMLTADAMKNNEGEPIKVLVSEPHQKTNIEKLAKDRGRSSSVREEGSDFVIIIDK